jgi:2-polyprenyl-6-methoxyphenol hydroxylase-like FAD-dependent oxidoreductase
VTGLITNDAKSCVTGVEFRRRAQPDQPHERMQADLVVDASGRESHAPRWLTAMGYEQPSVTVVNSFLGYASRVYQKPADDKRDWISLLVRAMPPASSRGGVVNPIERDRWMVTLGAAGRDYPPTDEVGFLEFARSLPVSTLYDAIKNAEPLTPVYGYRKTENRWQHYERLKRSPENFMVTGDAVCAFNPVYGQGMTSAAMGAATLDKCLHDHAGQFGGVAHDFQKRLAKTVSGPWLLATGDDFRYPETEGARRDAMTRLMHRYMDVVMRLANQDPHVFMTFFEVLQLLKPVTALMAPRIIARVLAKTFTPSGKQQ